MNFTKLSVIAIAAAASALGQSAVPQEARRQIQQQQKYEREMNFYRAGEQKASDAYQNCINSTYRKAPGACDGYKEWEAYYQRMQGAAQRPIAQYPGQGMFPTPGQVAQGVVNGVMNGQTQFPTDPSQTLQQPPVDYRNAMGGYANEATGATPGQLPYGGFQNYAQQPRYQQPVNQQPRYQQPANQQPRYQQPRTQQPRYQQPPVQQPRIQPANQQPVYQQPPTMTYPQYQGYGGYPANSRRY